VSFSLPRIILDTNALLNGLIAAGSASRRILRAAEDRLVIPLLSKPVLDEYVAVLLDEELREQFPHLDTELVEVTIRRLRYVGEYIRAPRTHFEYRRDPRDEKFIELAIALRADYLITFDEDLLSLPTNRGEAGRRFRQRLRGVQLMKPRRMVERFAGII
jgi:putative PIN family toxin of toxin-antitoxin system